MPKQEICYAKADRKQANIFRKKGGDYVADTTTERKKKTAGNCDIDTYNRSLTQEQRKQAASRAGKASAAAARQRGFIRKRLLELMDDKTTDDILTAMLVKAKKGDVAMTDLLYKTIGEGGADAVKVGVDDNMASLLCSLTTADKIRLLEQAKNS